MSKKEYFIILLLFLSLAAGYYIRESQGFIVERINTSTRDLLIVGKENPDLFKNDPVFCNISTIKYIPSQLFLLTKLKNWAGDLVEARKILLVILVFFTSWTTFLLYYKLTSNLTISALAVVASIVGVIRAPDEWFGFMGIDATSARYNLGIFAPLLLLFYLKNFHSMKMLSLLFLLLGLGVNLHPPQAITFAMVCILTFMIIQKFEVRYIKQIFIWIIFFIIGALPFIIYFGDKLFGRPGLPSGGRMAVGEFYNSGVYLYTNTWLSAPLKLLVRYFYFIPYITMGCMMIMYFWVSKDNKNISNVNSKNEDKILLTVAITSFCLIIFNLLFFGAILPRIIGPHSLSLHRVDRLLILILELFVVKLCVSLWRSKYSRILRVVLIACILVALAGGFSGMRTFYYGCRMLNINWDHSVMQICFAIFLSLCMLLVMLKQKAQRHIIILFLLLITAPHIIRTADGLVKTYNLLLNRKATTNTNLERFHFGPSFKNVALWARDNTKPGSIFMLSNQYINIQFKSIALRPTTVSRYERDYVKLRERPEFLRKVEEIEKVFKSKDPEKIIELAKKHKVDYIVIMQYPKYDFGRKNVYKDRYFEVFSVSEK